MAQSGIASFYRRGNSVTRQMFGSEACDSEAFNHTPRAPVSQHEQFMTPPFTPNRWSSESPQGYSSASVSMSVIQKLDRVLSMFGEMKSQAERDSMEVKEQLSILQDEMAMLKEKQLESVSRVKRKIPCDVSVSCTVFNIYMYMYLTLFSHYSLQFGKYMKNVMLV